MSESKRELTQGEWASVVYSVLADHPDWVATTVNALQEGVVQAIERQKDRALVLSLGLMEAVGNPLRGKRRNHDRIIDAIEASQLHPTKWSEAAIEREKQNRDRKKAS